MEVTNLSDAKNRLSELVEKARSGQPVRILVRGVAAVDLVPVRDASPSEASSAVHLADLERRGIIRRGTGVFPATLLSPGPRLKGGALASDAVIAEREDRC